MFFNIGIGIHIESQLNMFRFVDDISSEMEVFPVSEMWGAAMSCKNAISCTPVSRESGLHSRRNSLETQHGTRKKSRRERHQCGTTGDIEVGESVVHGISQNSREQGQTSSVDHRQREMTKCRRKVGLHDDVIVRESLSSGH
jgi:hypothetical protein